MNRGAWTPAAGWRVGASLVAALVLIGGAVPGGQIQYLSGQNIAPDFQGWEANADGTFDMIFGYMNRNYEEHLYIPIGPDNNIEPGGPDRGQPTFFLPRRNRNVLRIKVPADFGKKELVWTLTANGKTERAYGTLKPDYAHDKAGPVSQLQRDVDGGSGREEPGARRLDRRRHTADGDRRASRSRCRRSPPTTAFLPRGRRHGEPSGSGARWGCAWPGSSFEVRGTR